MGQAQHLLNGVLISRIVLNFPNQCYHQHGLNVSNHTFMGGVREGGLLDSAEIKLNSAQPSLH